jgi:hypothetical protein
LIYLENQIGTVPGPTGPTGEIGPTGPTGAGVAGNSDVGVMFLKDNSTPTPISAIGQRKVVEGSMQTGILYNFIKDPLSNSLKYLGPGGRFHIVASFNFFEGNQRTCGFYIGLNTDDTTPLDPDANRISESEIYINSANPTNQPVGGTIQTVLDLQTGDRVFFIVQNLDIATNITVQFLKFTVTALTAEKGGTGPSIPLKSGYIQGSTFSGVGDLSANVLFDIAYPNTDYSITVTGEDARIWSVSTKANTGFEINSNSPIAFVGNVYWQTLPYGESN